MAAGALWALALVAPRLADPIGAVELTVARYTVFGLGSIAVLALLRHNPFRQLSLRLWGLVIVLGLCANTLCYATAAWAIQIVGPAPVGLILGALPMLVPIVANLRRRQIAWRRLAPPLALMGAGLTLVGIASAGISTAGGRLAAMGGVALAVVSLLSWLIYAVLNAEHLRAHPDTSPLLWTCLTGVGTLVTLPPLVGLAALFDPSSINLGAPPEMELIGWGLVLGLGSAWLATWLWNGASARLPGALLGYLIVSETIFVIAYDSLIEGAPPPAAILASALLIIGGVIWGLGRAQPRHSERPPPADT